MAATGQESLEAERMAAWVREYGPAVRGYLMALVRRADEVEDLAQEVFCRAWQWRGRYEEHGHARKYLLRIADRLACDLIRRKRPEETLSDDAWRGREPWSHSGDPAQRAADSEAAERLRAALDQLAPLQQRVLLLRYYGQLSFQEIAETLGCPLNTALSHCHRGLESLRRQFAEDMP